MSPAAYCTIPYLPLPSSSPPRCHPHRCPAALPEHPRSSSNPWQLTCMWRVQYRIKAQVITYDVRLRTTRLPLPCELCVICIPDNCHQLVDLLQPNDGHEAVPVGSHHQIICNTKGSFASYRAATLSELMSFKMLAARFSYYLQVLGSLQFCSQSESVMRLAFQLPVGQGDELVLVQVRGQDQSSGLPDSGWKKRGRIRWCGGKMRHTTSAEIMGHATGEG